VLTHVEPPPEALGSDAAALYRVQPCMGMHEHPAALVPRRLGPQFEPRDVLDVLVSGQVWSHQAERRSLVCSQRLPVQDVREEHLLVQPFLEGNARGTPVTRLHQNVGDIIARQVSWCCVRPNRAKMSAYRRPERVSFGFARQHGAELPFQTTFS